MHIYVRNFIRATEATMVLSAAPLHLIGGRNGAGKTSVLDAIECILIGDMFPTDRGLTKKKDLVLLVTKGAKKASVRWLEEDSEPGWDATLSITKSDQTIESTGRPPYFDRVMLGRSSLFRLKPAERVQYLTDALGVQPIADDLFAYLGERGLTKISDAQRAALTEAIAEGWDAALTKYTDLRRLMKSEWEAVTREKWGAEKAEGWEPNDGLPDSLKKMTVEPLNAKIAEAQAAYDEALKQVGVAEGRRQHLEELASGAKDLAGQVREAHRETQAIQAELDKVIADLDATPPPEGAPTQPCPWCEEPIEIRWQANQAVLAQPSVEAISEDERRQRVQRRHEVSQQRDALIAKLRDAQKAENHLAASLEQAEAAKKELDEAAGKGSEDEVMAKPRADLERATVQKAAWEQWRLATKKQMQIKAYSLIVDALAPEGVRGEKLGKALDALNDAMAQVAKRLGVDPAPRVLPSGGFEWLGGSIPYQLLSHSHRLRMDLMVGMALQIVRGDRWKIVIMDELEAVSKDDRLRIMGAMVAYGFIGILAQVADKATSIPSTKDMGDHGVAYWMDAGVLEEV